jgi:hypothetical protein
LRATGKDIAELFGHRPDDISSTSTELTANRWCPFVDDQCSKTNHNRTEIYGVCSVTKGANSSNTSDIPVCPKRFYGDDYLVLRNISEEVWGRTINFIAGGNISELNEKLSASTAIITVVAFGQKSGKEVSVRGRGQMSMDWVLQSYILDGSEKVPKDFIGVEVQSIDITGNYRENQKYYLNFRNCGLSEPVDPPNSQHGLNWANVHKRLIPQLIRKGNVYRQCERCIGFFFVVPSEVFVKFEEVLGNIEPTDTISNNVVSVATYALDGEVLDGEKRVLNKKKTVHLPLDSIISAFSENQMGDVHRELDEKLLQLLETK